jgi:hypothetical protein
LAPGLDKVKKRIIPAAAENRNSLSSLLSVISGAETFRIIRITWFVRDRVIVRTNRNLLEKIQSIISEFAMTLLLIFKF